MKTKGKTRYSEKKVFMTLKYLLLYQFHTL